MNKQEAQKAIKQIIISEPWLSTAGLHSFEYAENSIESGRDCFGNKTTYKEFLANLARERKGCETYWQEFAGACELLKGMRKIKSINKRYSSYGLKHLFEKKTGYLPNGIFIAAALYSGFKYKAVDGSPNPYFNISNASLKALEKEVAET